MSTHTDTHIRTQKKNKKQIKKKKKETHKTNLTADILRRIQPCPFVQPRDCYVITTNSTIYVYVSLLFKFVTFCSLQDRENAECLVFIHFPSQIYLKTLTLDKTPRRGQAKRRGIPFDIKKGDPPTHPHPTHKPSSTP